VNKHHHVDVTHKHDSIIYHVTESQTHPTRCQTVKQPPTTFYIRK